MPVWEARYLVNRLLRSSRILKKLGDKEGILHLETYSENNTTITFEMKEISQEN